MKKFLIFTCASLPHCNTHSSGAPMTYRETSIQTVAARDVPLDPLGDSTQPHAHKWGLVGAIAPLCDSPRPLCENSIKSSQSGFFITHLCRNPDRPVRSRRPVRSTALLRCITTIQSFSAVAKLHTDELLTGMQHSTKKATCYRKRECRILRSHTHWPSRRAEGILVRTRDRPRPA